jgi:hypothetical protein
LLPVALQAGLSLAAFAVMQAVTLGRLGISELQNLKTSPMQVARCSGLPWANPADEDEARGVLRLRADESPPCVNLWPTGAFFPHANDAMITSRSPAGREFSQGGPV